MTPTELRDLVRETAATHAGASPEDIARLAAEQIDPADRETALVLLLTSLAAKIGASKPRVRTTPQVRVTAKDQKDFVREEDNREGAERAVAAAVPFASLRVATVHQSWQERLDMTYRLPGGAVKPLRQFTADECELMGGGIRRKAQELHQDANKFTSMAKEMRRTGARTVEDLRTADAQRILGAAA